MNQDDVLRMARESGFQDGWASLWSANFARFAAMVAAAEREAFIEALLAARHEELMSAAEAAYNRDDKIENIVAKIEADRTL